MLASSRLARPQQGFTLVEMLVVIAIIGILASLIVPAVQMARARAQMTNCLSNLRELGRATIVYESQNRKYPALFTDWTNQQSGAVQLHPWQVSLLPFLDQQLLYDEIQQFGLPQAEQAGFLSFMNCPSDPASDRRGAATTYVGNSGQPDVNYYGSLPLDLPGTGIFYDRSVRAGTNPFTMNATRVRDGGSTTFLFSENANLAVSDVEFALNPGYLNGGTAIYTGDPTSGHQEFGFGMVWSDPFAANAPPSYFGDRNMMRMNFANVGNAWELARPSSWHAQAFNAVFADGHTDTIGNTLSYAIYAKLLTPDSSKIPAGSVGVGRVDENSFVQ